MSETAQEPTEIETEPAADEPAEDPAGDDGADDEPAEDEPDPDAPEDAQPDAEDELPPAASAVEGMSQTEANEIIKRRTAAWQTFRRNTVEAWQGEAVNLFDCPLCSDSHKGLIDVRDAGQYPKEIVDNVMGFLGLAREQDYKQSSSHNPCSFCDANGKVATGSHVPEFTTVTCPECKGFGYTPPPSTGNVVSLPGTGVGLPPVTPPDDIQTGEVDNWGEMRILPDGRPNPNFGKQPSFKVLVEPYGVTANLTAVGPVAAPVEA